MGLSAHAAGCGDCWVGVLILDYPVTTGQLRQSLKSNKRSGKRTSTLNRATTRIVPCGGLIVSGSRQEADNDPADPGYVFRVPFASSLPPTSSNPKSLWWNLSMTMCS
eukprot:981222-Amphidinium_carterae.6